MNLEALTTEDRAYVRKAIVGTPLEDHAAFVAVHPQAISLDGHFTAIELELLSSILSNLPSRHAPRTY